MLDNGRDILIYYDMEEVSFHLKKDWENVKKFQEKESCFQLELTVEFNGNHEARCSLRIESDGRQ